LTTTGTGNISRIFEVSLKWHHTPTPTASGMR
jgi:hypothetical protein